MKKKEEKFFSKYQALIIGVIFAIIVLILWFSSWIGIEYYSNLSENSFEARGTFGDMFGAVNALFSGLAFVGLIVAILLQRQELELQRNELTETREEFEKQNKTMAQQRIENTFFNMLTLHNDIINSMKNGNNDGRAAIGDYAKNFINIKRSRDIYKAFVEFKKQYGNKIDHYFRNMYNIIKFIDKTESLSDEAKKIYTNLLRAQLSDGELYLLFYNCLSSTDYIPFKLLVEKYSILKHVSNVESKYKKMYQSRAFSKTGDFKDEKDI